MSKDGADAAKVLSHPLRIKIIRTIGASGPLSWKELSGKLGVSTGALYHHLDMLETIVARDHSRKYTLTKLGEDVYRHLQENPTGNPFGAAKIVERRSVGSVLMEVLVPRDLIQLVSSDTTRAVVSSVVLAAAVLAVFELSGVQPLLLSLAPSQGVFQTAAFLAASLAALTLASYAMSAATHAKANPAVLVLSGCASYLPLAGFSLVVEVAASLGRASQAWGVNGITLLFVLFQGWSMTVFGAGISVSTGMRIEKALVWGLLVLYASVTLMLLSGVRFV